MWYVTDGVILRDFRKRLEFLWTTFSGVTLETFGASKMIRKRYVFCFCQRNYLHFYDWSNIPYCRWEDHFSPTQTQRDIKPIGQYRTDHFLMLKTPLAIIHCLLYLLLFPRGFNALYLSGKSSFNQAKNGFPDRPVGKQGLRFMSTSFYWSQRADGKQPAKCLRLDERARQHWLSETERSNHLW